MSEQAPQRPDGTCSQGPASDASGQARPCDVRPVMLMQRSVLAIETSERLRCFRLAAPHLPTCHALAAERGRSYQENAAQRAACLIAGPGWSMLLQLLEPTCQALAAERGRSYQENAAQRAACLI